MIHVYVPPVYTLNTTYTVIVKFDLFSNDSEFFKGSVDYEIKIPVLYMYQYFLPGEYVSQPVIWSFPREYLNVRTGGV